MIVRSFGIARCKGEQNLMNAIQDKANEGFSLIALAFAGQELLAEIPGVVLPASMPKEAAITLYTAIFEKVEEFFESGTEPGEHGN